MQSPTKTLAEIFGTDRRLTVPLFQRRYVWNREKQWDRLWDDIVGVAKSFLAAGRDEDQIKKVRPPFTLLWRRTNIAGESITTTRRSRPLHRSRRPGSC